jgi:hypothetical protein
MDIGKRLLELRTAKNLSQGDIERSTGLLRCYISRVENGHTVAGCQGYGLLCDKAAPLPGRKRRGHAVSREYGIWVLALEDQSGSALATSQNTIAVEAELFLNHGEPGSYPVQTRVGSPRVPS